MKDNKLIVKDNALITASHKLNEVEQRLILLAIVKARSLFKTVEQLKGQEITIQANEYIEMFNVDKTVAYKVLKQSVLGLYRAEWGYKFINEQGLPQVSFRRFIQSADYIDGGAMVHFKFSDEIIPMLVELEKRFTVYELGQVSNLSSRYALRMYEFFMQHFDKQKGKGWLKISIDELRFRLGLLPTEYMEIKNLKARVIDNAMKQINERTDLKASYTQEKKGRVIVGFVFEFERKKTVKNKPEKMQKSHYENLTDDEQKAVKKRVRKHIKRLESKGEKVSESHKENIEKKAISEKWGIEELETEKRRQEAEIKQRQVEEQERKKHIETVKMEEEDNLRAVELFNSLTSEEQTEIFELVLNAIPSFFKVKFKNADREEKIEMLKRAPYSLELKNLLLK